MTTYFFGPFRLDAETEILFRGNEPTNAGQRAVALLRVLVERPGVPISKTVLIDAVWPNLAVEESNLSVQIATLRKVLGREPGGEDWIETLPRRGYRFVGPTPTDRANNGVPGRLPSEIQDATRPAPMPRVFPSAEEASRPEESFPPAPSQERRAERRQLTIMACELVGTAALSGRLDADAFRVVLEAHHRHCREVINSHGGHVVSYLPDGLIAYFGEPLTREQDAENALHAGLVLASNDLPRESEAIPRLEVRIGVASGTVIMDQLVAGINLPDRAAIGEAPNLAQQLKAAADAGTVIVSRTTRDLARGLFEYRAIGPVALEGSSEPVDAWQVLRASDSASRFDARSGRSSAERLDSPARSLSPFVGRGREMDALRKFAVAETGSARVIDLVGEPGIGKSRLLHEFRAELMEQNVYVLAGSCWPDSQETAFRPFIEVVRRSFRLRAGLSEEEMARELEHGLTLLGLAEAENLGLLMNLLGLASRQGTLQGLSDVVVGQRTRELLIRLVHERSRFFPLALLLEDLHWIDLASEQLLAELIASKSSPPLLIVTTSRPEYRPPWEGQPNCTAMRLEPLSAAATGRIVESRLASGMDASAVVPLVVGKAEGNPLFAEEIINYLIEQADLQGSEARSEAGGVNPPIVVPASIQALLATRVDRLAPADKSLLQAASVIGRRFNIEVLAAATNLRADFAARMAALEQLDLVRRDASSREFVFKHALVRDALYASLLSGPRKLLHLSVADEIERRSANRLIEVAEPLAYHYRCAESAVKAFRYFVMAAWKSLDIYALEEAEQHFRGALEFAEADPVCASDSEFTDMMAGFTRLLNLDARVKELTELVERHLPRIEAAGDSGDLVLILHHYSWALLTRAQFKAAHEISRRSMEVAKRLGDNCLLAYGQSGFVHTSTILSPLPLDSFEKFVRDALQLSDGPGDSYLRTWVLFTIAWDYINRGLTREARDYAERVLEAARAYVDPRGFGVGLWLLGWVDLVEERYYDAAARADECIRAALTPLDRSVGIQIKGLALALSGKVEEGTALLRGVRSGFLANDWRFNLSGTDLALSVATVLAGAFSKGIRLCEKYIREQEAAGYQTAADWARLNLAEIYLEMLTSEEKPPLKTILKNIIFLLRLKASGPARISRLLDIANKNTQFSERGILRARIELSFARLYAIQGRSVLTRNHLARAKHIAEGLCNAALLARIDKLDQTSFGG